MPISEEKRLYNKQYREKHRTLLIARKRKWDQENKAHRIAYAKSYRSDNKQKISIHKKAFYQENAEKLKAKSKEWCNNNKDHKKAYLKQWKRENADLVKASIKAWYKANPEAKRTYDAARKASRKKINGKYTADDLKMLMLLQKRKCAICQNDIVGQFHVDHILPLSKGGRNDRQNIQLTHPTCNQQKYDKDPIHFMQERGYLL